MISRITTTSKVASLIDEINELESLRREQPLTFSLYCELAHLHYEITLVYYQLKQYFKSYQAIEKAILYNPYVEAFPLFKQKLTETMRNLRKRQVLKGNSFNLGFNFYNRNNEIYDEIQKGFEIMNSFGKSKEAKEIEKNRELAFYKEVKEKIISEKPANKNNEGHLKATKANLIFHKILNTNIKDTYHMLEEWKKQVIQYPELEKVSLNQVQFFIQKVIHHT